MVGLRRENRTLLKHGLKVLGETQRPGLQALIEVLELQGRDLDAQDIGFAIAPKLNALSRLEEGLRPLDILLCEDPKQARMLASQVLEMNEKRKALQKELEDRILAQLDPSAPVHVLAALGHGGVVGLVATKVSQITGAPAFCVALTESEGIGSARAQMGVNLPDLLREASPYLERFGGHAQAAGFSLVPSQFQGFRTSLMEGFGRLYPKGLEDASFSLVYDVEAELHEFDTEFMKWLKHAGPFGPDNPSPLFQIRGLTVKSMRWLKDLHLKVELTDGRSKADGIAFNCRDRFGAITQGARLDALVEPAWNYWNGRRTLQLMIKDLKIKAG
jgi:single-stranded-DNA-specific exonuclease